MRLTLLLALTFAACASPAPDGVARPFDSEASYQSQREAALRALDVAIGRPAAGDAGACRAVAVGEKACGGPAAFALYSLATADPSLVEMAASRVAALDRRAIAQFGLASTCDVVEPPPLAVRDGLCVADR